MLSSGFTSSDSSVYLVDYRLPVCLCWTPPFFSLRLCSFLIYLSFPFSCLFICCFTELFTKSFCLSLFLVLESHLESLCAATHIHARFHSTCDVTVVLSFQPNTCDTCHSELYVTKRACVPYKTTQDYIRL